MKHLNDNTVIDVEAREHKPWMIPGVAPLGRFALWASGGSNRAGMIFLVVMLAFAVLGWLGVIPG